MELLERADALDVLDDLLARSASGGRIAVVTGEAGAGKSTLVTAFGRARWPGASPACRRTSGATACSTRCSTRSTVPGNGPGRSW
jgi:hypothetical protein